MPLATGGILSTLTIGSVNYNVHTFTTSGSLTFTTGGAVEYLVVAGGGAGGSTPNADHRGGGGGAGGLVAGSVLVNAQTYTITIGAGGTPVAGSTGGSGGNSTFDSLVTALGGGGGGMSSNGANGGSGGGGGAASTASNYSGGTATQPGSASGGFGNNGGTGGTDSVTYRVGGGGGGAGGVGTNGSNNPANGGVGLSSSISGTATFYAGGGGGGGRESPGGTGGGGAGSGGGSGVAATANTGGGGGGCGAYSQSGGAGGSGIIIVRYIAESEESAPLVYPLATGGTINTLETTSLGSKTTYNAHIFTTSGNLTVTAGGLFEYLVVGGGGGGGSDMGGGGGAGGFITGFIGLEAGTYTVTVGAGGPGATAGTDQPRATNGGSSAITPVNFKGHSYYYDGVGDYWTASANAAFDFGTGDLTIECWVWPVSNGQNYPTFLSSVTGWSAGASGHRFNNINYANKFWFGLNGSGGVASGDPFMASTNTYSFNTWHHYAITRSGNTWRMFVNGTLQNTQTYTGSYNCGLGGLRSGWSTWDGAQGHFTGFVSNLRIIKGTALYTGAFTVSTTPLTAVTNTSLLTNQDNSYVDNSTNNFTITVTGNLQPSHFTPFTDMAIGAAGGGGGASDHTSPASTSAAAFGGSGGGASGNNANRGVGIPGQGSAGANSAGSWYPGGGGGANGTGSTNPANGGAGRASSILGTQYYWAGGGAGAGYTAVSGNGGIGGGGGGAPKSTSGGGSPGAGTYAQGQVPYALVGNYATFGSLNSQTNVPGGDGIVNSGGGGGGGSHLAGNNRGGTGGSGMVIIKYIKSRQGSGAGGVGGPYAGGGGGAGNDGYIGRVVPTVVRAFTSSGNLTVTGSGPVEYLIVGGGGGGGSDMGGGGGGGGYLAGNITLSSGTYLVTVGAGGAGAPAGVSQPPGSNGGDSAIQSLAVTNTNRFSYYFDTYNDFISFSSNVAFDIGSNDASKELWFWMYKDDGTYHTFCGQNSSTGSTIRIAYNTGSLYYSINNDTARGGTSVDIQTWYHVLVTYTGGTAKFFVNGQLRDVTTGLGSITARAETYVIGQEDSIWMDGYISNFRFCNGSIPSAYQTASTTIGAQIFTPPTQPLTTTSQGAANVSLLTCQSSTIVDNSPNNFTPTKTGDVISVRFNPFEDLTAVGGGGGASEYSNNNSPGRSGGSGGGTAGDASTTFGRGIRPNIQGKIGQGFNGGASGGRYYPSGGGGAGAAGSAAPGNGGNGVQNAILGTSYYWAAGGGGAGYSANPGNGGLGGGGGGAPKQSSTVGIAGTGGYNAGTDGTVGTLVAQTNVPGGNGGTNTGSGGGGGAHYNINNNGGAGGSGIVILKYRPDQITLSGGNFVLDGSTLDNIYSGGIGGSGETLSAGGSGSLFGGGGGGSGALVGGGGGGINVIGVINGTSLGGVAGGTFGGDGQAGVFGYAGSNGNGGIYGGGGGGTTNATVDPNVGNGAPGALAIFWQGNILQYPSLQQANNVSAFGTIWALAPAGNIAQGYLRSGVTIESLEAGFSGNTDAVLRIEVKSESRPTANSNLGILTDTVANAVFKDAITVNSITVKPTMAAVNNIAVQELQIITYRTDDEMMLVTVQNTGGYTNSAQRIDRITEENDPRRVKAYLLNYIVGVTGEDNDIIQTQIWF